VLAIAAAAAAVSGGGVLAGADTVRVSGKVVETSTGAAIPGATIKVSGCRPKPVGAAQVEQRAQLLSTDENGAFALEAAKGVWCQFEPTAPGYGKPIDRFVAVTPAAPLSVTLKLPRAAVVSGKVVDAESGEPISDLPVTALQTVYERGRRVTYPERHAGRTDSAGAFVFDSLPPGDFVIELSERKVSPSAYPRTIWPGAGDVEASQPFLLSAGVTLHLGTLKMTKRSFPNLSIRISGGNCHEGEVYSVSLVEPIPTGAEPRGELEVPCGRAVVAQITPGEYRVEAEAPWQEKAVREYGAADVQVLDRDLEITVPVSPPIPIRGRIAVQGDDAKAPPFQKAVVHIFPVYSRDKKEMTTHSAPTVSIEADGSFESFYYPPPGRTIEVISFMPQNYYVSQVKYNQRTVGEIFLSDPGAPQQELEIICAAGAGAISGTVVDKDGQGAPGIAVLGTPWPADVVFSYPNDLMETTTDASGSYSFRQLKPGKYKVLAVAPAQRQELEKPGKLMALFQGLDPIEIGNGASVFQRISVSEFR
jgi:uncharacterized GH25 family protein